MLTQSTYFSLIDDTPSVERKGNRISTFSPYAFSEVDSLRVEPPY